MGELSGGPGTGPVPFRRALAGVNYPGAVAVEAWTTCAWLLSVEVRAYLEDLEGGAEQPAMRQVVKLRLLELLTDIDARLRGATPPEEDHLLALGLELGLDDAVRLEGEDLLGACGLSEGVLDPGDADAAARGTERAQALFTALIHGFPGELPNPLLASGQMDQLRALKTWSKLAEAAGIDAGHLLPFLEDA